MIRPVYVNKMVVNLRAGDPGGPGGPDPPGPPKCQKLQGSGGSTKETKIGHGPPKIKKNKMKK